jgi:peptidase M50-like protein
VRLGDFVTELSVGFLLVAYIVVAGPSWESAWDPCFTLVLVVLLGIPSSFLHEFGHALAGRILGYRLSYIRVGTGRVFSFGRRLQIGSNLLLTGGFTTFQSPIRPITRPGTVFLYGAGALVNLALVLVALLLLRISSSVGWGLLIVNFAAFLHNLIPARSWRTPGGWNDGAEIWSAVFDLR